MTDSARLDAVGNYRVVFELTEESSNWMKATKKIQQTDGFQSLREASIAMLHIIEARGYSTSNVLGAKVIDLDQWPVFVAFISFLGEIYEEHPMLP